jgi:hypothetical protein
VPRTWTIPEGLRVLADGSWRVGELPVVHDRGLVYLKSHLVFENGGAFVVDGARRMPVVVEGPAFEATQLRLDFERGSASVILDDGTEESLTSTSLGMSEETGRFECAVRGGLARAVLSRAAHQVLLEHVDQEDGRFFLRVGAVRIPVRT